MKSLYLYLSVNAQDILVGKITSNFVRGEEVFSFEYYQDYLLNHKYLIDPNLFPYSGAQYNMNFINDMIPDRFGSLLIDKMEQKIAIEEKRAPKQLTISDYLVRVNDLTRMGALRIKESVDGPFINDDLESIPEFTYLRDIEYASIQLEEKQVINNDLYKRLLMPGSSLGGARPKATIYLNNDIYLAKFPSKNDTYDVELWEYIINQIAFKLGIDVPDSSLYQFSNYGHTFMAKRFDRKNGKRIHYISAVTALSTTDGNSGNFSYLDLVNFINTNCNRIKENLLELYKRIIFTYLINNTDNHLRNHAFIYQDDELVLSPMFDVNPSFYLSDFELPFGNGNDIKGIINISPYFYIEKEQAKALIDSNKDEIIEMLEEYMIKYPMIKDEGLILIDIIKNKC